MDLIPLEAEAHALCLAVNAPPRLIAHLTLVHDVAFRLMRALDSWPEHGLDKALVCFGAATHDLGKAKITAELSGPGKAHESAGLVMMLGLGVPEARARFAVTHGAELSEALQLEDLMVQLADACWKGKRRRTLEETIARRLSGRLGTVERDFFELYLWLDETVESIARDAEARLLWQGQHPVKERP